MAQRISEQIVEWLTVGGNNFTPQTIVPLHVQGRTVLGTTTVRSGLLEDSNHVTVNGHMVINGSYNNTNSYSEGLRINRSSNGQAMIALGGNQNSWSGTGKSVWYIGALSTPADATTVTNNITDSVFNICLNGSSLGEATPSLRINSSGTTIGTGLGIANTSKTTGYGLSLYNGAVNGIPQYGMFFGGTSTFKSLGNIAMINPGQTSPAPAISDSWATYFTMNKDANRGWIFEKVDGTTYTPVAGINNDGSINTAVPNNTYINGLRGIGAALNLTDTASGHHTIFRVKSSNGAFILAQYDPGLGIEYGSNSRLNGGSNGVDEGILLMNEVGESRFNKIKIQNTTSIATSAITWPEGKTTAEASKFGLWINQYQTWLSAPASTTSNMSSQLIISSVDDATGNGGNVALELWRGKNVSWQFSNESGNLHIRNNYTSATQNTYSQDSITVAYTGVTTFNGTTDSSATSNGTVIVKGGVGIAKELHVGTRIKIHSTSAVKHIEFSRNGWNYMALPDNADAVLAIGFGTAGDNDNQKLVITQTGVVRPGSNNTESLGTSTKAWAQIYGNGLHANVANSNVAGGVSLYGTNPVSYGIAMRTGAAHGWITQQQSDANIARAQGISTSDTNGTDWAINLYNSGSKLRGLKFMHDRSPVASINGYGYAQFNRIGLNRHNGTANGRIYWYDPSYYTWVDYMSDVADGIAPTGGKPSSISNVTTWAQRSLIEQTDGYGWIWESATNAVATAQNTTVIPRMSLSSYDGRLTLTGDIWHKTATRTAGAITFHEHSADGTAIHIGSGGFVAIGGGEAPQTITNQTYKARIADLNNGAEQLWAISDGEMKLIVNAQNIGQSNETTYNNYAEGNKPRWININTSLEVFPWLTRRGSLGNSSNYWNSAFIYSKGQIHNASINWGGVGSSITDQEDLDTTSAEKGLTAWRYKSYQFANKTFGLSAESVQIQYSTNATVDSSTGAIGGTWQDTTEAWYNDTRKRDLFNFQETQIPVGNLPKFDYGSSATAQAAQVGYGVQVTADFTEENRTFYASAIETYWRCYCCTCVCVIEIYNAARDEWVELYRATYTNSDTRRFVHLGYNLYSDGARQNRNTATYMNKMRWTLVVTAVGTSNKRYVPSIAACALYGPSIANSTSGSYTPSGGTATVSKHLTRLAWTMSRWNTPIYVSSYNASAGLGSARIGVENLQVGDDLKYTAANTEKWSYITLGNSYDISAENPHSQGRLRLYSAATNYHDLVGNSTTVAHTHTLPNADGTIVQCLPAVDGDTDYQAGIIYNQNKPNYPTSYGSGIILPYRKADLNTKTDYTNQIYIPTGDNSTYGNTMFYRTSIANAWNDWHMVVFAPSKTAVGNVYTPVYIDNKGSATIAKGLPLYEARSETTTLNKTANYVGAGAMFHLIASSSTNTANNGKPALGDANVLQMNWDNNGGYDSQLAISTGANRMEFRSRPSQSTAWREVVTSTPGTAVGSTSVPAYIETDGVATAITPSQLFSVLSWTAGTTAGPILNVTIAGQARTATIPSAAAGASGVVTTAAQQFDGDKTFKGHIYPQADSTYDIGKKASHWGSGYFDKLLVSPNTDKTAGQSITYNSRTITPILNVEGTLYATDQIENGGYFMNNVSDTSGGYYIDANAQAYGRYYIPRLGTTSTAGIGRLELGNSIASGTAKNAYGEIYLFGQGSNRKVEIAGLDVGRLILYKADGNNYYTNTRNGKSTNYWDIEPSSQSLLIRTYGGGSSTTASTWRTVTINATGSIDISSNSNGYSIASKGAVWHNGSNLWVGSKGQDTDVFVGHLYLNGGVNSSGVRNPVAYVALGDGTATTGTSYPIVHKNKTGSATNGIYLDANGKTFAMTYSLNATINAGTTNYFAYYSGAHTIDYEPYFSRSDSGVWFNNNSATEIRYRLTNSKADVYFFISSGGNRGIYQNGVTGSSNTDSGYLLQWPNGSMNAFFPNGNLGVKTSTNTFTREGSTSSATYNFAVNGTAMITSNLDTNGAIRVYTKFNTSNASDSKDIVQFYVNGDKWCNFNVFRDASNLGCGIWQVGNATTSTSNGSGARGTVRIYGPGTTYYQFNNMYTGSSFTISLDSNKILQFPCHARIQSLLAVGGTSISTTTWSSSTHTSVSCGTKDPVGAPTTGVGTVYFKVL